MMEARAKRIVNFGSLNIDHVYRVEHFVRPGETVPSLGYEQYAGGKGGNQSLALARAGADVFHAGKTGAEGAWLKELLAENGVNTDNVEITEGPGGHAVIQVNPEGENAIVLYGGSNREITPDDAKRVLAGFGPGDFLLSQNEISSIPEIITIGAERGLDIFFNPAPMSPEVLDYPLEAVKFFIINETEGEGLTGETEPERILDVMAGKFPEASVVLTLGERGAVYRDSSRSLNVPASKVQPVDTTAAGDTFIGYFLAQIMTGRDTEEALKAACCAAAVCVTKAGAADSIPWKEEVPIT